MAQIVKYVSQQELAPNRTGIPNTRVQSFVGEALGRLGGTIEDVAASIQSREEQKEDFKAQANYRTLQMQLDDQMRQRAEGMAEDGTGFHDDFLQNVYTPARNDFLNGLSPRLRERYEVLLGDGGPDTENWSIKAATRQRDQLYSWAENTLGASREQLATAISMDPEAYDQLLQAGMDEINASPLPESQKVVQRRAWEEMAQVSHLNRLLETKPETVLRSLGADPRMLTPTTQYGLLKAALIEQETGGEANPDRAVSPAGALGRMQVMPGTARDIAKEIGDTSFNPNWDPAQIGEYLSNPTINERYGDYYLKKQIREFAGKGGLEAALIAYNGGPGRAKKWIESGFDDSVLPAETRKYYKAIMSRLPTLPGQKGMAGDPTNVKLEFNRKGMAAIAGQSEDKLNPDLTNRVKTSFAALGIDSVRITSGYRSAADNKRVKGAKASQHLHGNAMDIDVSGYSREKRKEIIRALSANGITGIGVGANIIHADLGGRRAWGYASPSGGAEVPAWAKDVINEHLENTAATPQRGPQVAGRYSTLPYQQRQKFIHAADTAVTRMATESAKATTAQKGDLRRAMANELATVQATGQSTDAVDDTAVSTILGEEAYNKWIIDRDRAQRTYDATFDIPQMSAEDMEDRLLDYRPTPGSETFAQDQQVEAAVQKAIDKTLKERARKPVEAAMKFPDVAEAWAEIANAENPEPEMVQAFIRLNLERQREFNLKPGSEKPVPREWSMQIGQALGKLPERGGRNLNDVNAAILLQYEALQRVFGDYTDEVILQALGDYNGVGENTAELITRYMEGIQAGDDPLGRVRQRLNAAEDRDQVEQLAEPGLWDRVKNFLFNTGEDEGEEFIPDPAGDPEVDPVLDEKVLRVMDRIRSFGALEPEDEANLVERFGEPAVRLAKERMGGQ